MIAIKTQRKMSNSRYIVIPYFGNPFLLPKTIDENDYKLFQQIVEGCFEYVKPKHINAIIHPMFRKDHKSWDIVGKLFESGHTSIYINDCGRLPSNECTPNMATILVGRGCPLFGRIVVRASENAIVKANNLDGNVGKYIKTKTFEEHCNQPDESSGDES